MTEKARIRKFVEEKLLKGRPAAAGEDLWEDGGLDSLGIVRLVRFIEETFGVSVPHADVTPKTFATVETIADYVARLTSRRRPGR